MADFELNPDTLGRALTYTEILSLLNYAPNNGVNVKWLGAKGDGSTDDTAAIQAAVCWNSVYLTVTAQTTSGTTLTFGSNLTADLRARIDAGTSVNVFNTTNMASIQHSLINAGNQAIVSSTTDTTVVISIGVLENVDIGDVIRFDFAHRGTIWFPPGDYKISSAITLDYVGEMSFRLQGSGMKATKVHGGVSGFAGYIFSRSSGNTTTGGRVIDGFYVANAHASGGGIFWSGCVNGQISNCKIEAVTGMQTYGGGPNTVLDCNFYVSTIGAMINGVCTFIGCDFTSCTQGIRHYSFGLVCIGCRFEVNTTGIKFGRDPSNVASQSSGCVIMGGSTESNTVAFDFDTAKSCAVIGVSITSSDATSAPGGTAASSGIYCASGASYITIQDCTVSGYYDDACIDLSDSADGAISVKAITNNTHASAPDYTFPTDTTKVQTFWPGQLPTSTVAQLPTAGAQYSERVLLVTDATTTTWSATAAAAGGSTWTVAVSPRNVGGTWTWTLA
jgi:hypothetical protein